MSHGRRFADAQDLRTLTRMLDEILPRLAAAGSASGGVLEIEARAIEPVQAGTLVQTLSNRSLRRASSALEIPANGVVVRALSGNRAVWSPLALVYLALPGGLGETGPGELWLGSSGLAVAARPTAGMMQKIGTRLYYDALEQKHLCLINPAPAFGDLVG